MVTEEIDRSISINEINEAISTLSIGKSLGPTNSYYKKFLSRLGVPICSYFNSINASNPLPTEALLAYITVIPKSGKDPQHCANYRPISLVNSDTKLLAKILALRLQDYIVKLAHSDQTGFMNGREARDNTIQALHILHWMQHGPDKALRVTLSMDAVKAFNRVNWVFMIEVLRGMGLGDRHYMGPRERE